MKKINVILISALFIQLLWGPALMGPAPVASAEDKAKPAAELATTVTSLSESDAAAANAAEAPKLKTAPLAQGGSASGEPSVSAAPASQSVSADIQKMAKQNKSVETLLTTLDSTLNENRKLKEQTDKLTDTIRKSVEVNTILQNRLKKLETQKSEGRTEQAEKIDALNQQIETLKNYMTDLRSQNTKTEDAKADVEKKLEASNEEIAKMKKLLETAILESERQQYLKLIQGAEETADRSVKEMAQANEEKLKMQTELAAIHDRLGSLYFESRQYEQAIAQYQREIELNPAAPAPYYNLGVIYDYYINDNARAIDQYRKYLKMEPVDEEARQIRERVLDLELRQEMVPKQPTREDFEVYEKKHR